MNFEEISVVVQGPFTPRSGDTKGTLSVLDSIRTHLPGAELILSTWVGHYDGSFVCDKIVESEDPGAFGDRSSNSFANLARQIVSTSAGLKQASRPFALKIRTDTHLSSSDFVSLWEIGRQRGLRPSLLKNKVLISALTSYNLCRFAIPYHPSDFFHFGETADLQSLWNVSFPDPDVIEYFSEGSISHYLNGVPGFTGLPMKMTPEQYLFCEFLKGLGANPKISGIRTSNLMTLIESDKLLSSHFVIEDPFECGIILPQKFEGDIRRRSEFYRTDLGSLLFRASSKELSEIILILRIPFYLAACLRDLGRRWIQGGSFYLRRCIRSGE